MTIRFFLSLLLATCLFAEYSGSTLYWSGLAATGTTSAYSVNANDKHTVQVTTTGSPSSCAIQLEGSLDNSHWFNLSRTTDTSTYDCSSDLMVHVTDRPVQFVRMNLTTLSGGTSPKVNVAYVSIRSGGVK